MVKALSKRGSASYPDAIDSAIDSYSAYIGKRNDRNKVPENLLPSCYPQAIFATRDSMTYRLFGIKTPHPCAEQRYPSRVVIGNGSIPAVALLKNTECVMRRLDLDWKSISTILAPRFCWMLLKRVEEVDPGTSGVVMHKIDESGRHRLTGREVWNDQNEESWFVTVAKGLIREIPKEQLHSLFEKFKLRDLYNELLPAIAVALAA